MGPEELHFISKLVVSIVYPPMLAFCIIGNILVVYVLSPVLKKKPVANIYYTVLAFVDIIGATLTFSYVIARDLAGVDIQAKLGCGNFTFIIFTFSDGSSWLVVAIAFDRLMHVYWPHVASRVCTILRAWIVAGIVLAACAAVNLHLPFTVDDENGTMLWMCPVKKGAELWLGTIWKYLDPLILAGLPFLLITSCGIAIVIRIRKISTNSENKKQERRANVLLGLVCVCFLLTLPPVVILHSMTGVFDFENAQQREVFNLLETIFTAIMAVNRAGNIIFYSIAAKPFRMRLKQLFVRARNRVGNFS